MPGRRLLYYITDRTAFGSDETSRRRGLLGKIREAARAGVDYIQLREKDLSARDLEFLGREAASVIAEEKTDNSKLSPTLLINSRTDVALAVGADGVHLRSNDISPEEAGKTWKSAAGTPAHKNVRREPIIAASCHSEEEVARAAAQNASFAVFAPVFEKGDAHPAGLDRLREACLENIPVLALGGVTLANARSCLAVGAAGIAAIRLFQENNIAEVVQRLRNS